MAGTGKPTISRTIVQSFADIALAWRELHPAFPSFIFVATIYRFVGDDEWGPNEQLATTKKHQTSTSAS